MPRWIMIMLVLSTLSLPPAAQAAPISKVYFEQTGHSVDDQVGFLRFWRANGQVQQLGFPITEPLNIDGRIVQYFERARLEFDGVIKLGRLGAELQPVQPAVGAQKGALYFAETGHNLRGEFLQYWQTHGGLARFGFPLSEALQENGMLVQWFERVRLEYHPEVMRPLWSTYQTERGLDLDPLNEVQISLLGREVAQRNGIATQRINRDPTVPAWSPALWNQRIRVNLSRFTLEAFEDDLRVLQAPVAIGKPGFETVAGNFYVYAKTPTRDMKSTENGESWDTKGVPFVHYFYRDWAIHGTYWHNQFGTRRSHGCVNLPLEAAEWLFSWTTPASGPGMTYGRGTLVEVVK